MAYAFEHTFYPLLPLTPLSSLLIYPLRSEQIGGEEALEADDACHHAGPKEHVGGHFALAFDIEEFLPRR